MIRALLCLALFASTAYSATLDSGKVVAEIDQWGFTENIFWPKGENQQGRLWSIHTGLSYNNETTYTRYKYTVDGTKDGDVIPSSSQ